MTVRMILVVNGAADDYLYDILADLLRDTLAANQDEYEHDQVAAMLAITHGRPCDVTVGVDGSEQPVNLIGVTVTLPDEVQYPERVLDEFTDALDETEPFVHAVRFEDERLREDLSALAGDLFDLEMKLRRVLTLIYLRAYPTDHPRDLLAEEKAKPTKDIPKAEELAARGENAFFYLNFSQYPQLNERPRLNAEQLHMLIGQCSSFDMLHAELKRLPVVDDDDAGLIAGLRQYLNPIEKMRNCVAHNRRPSDKLRNDYTQARPVLLAALEDFLRRVELG